MAIQRREQFHSTQADGERILAWDYDDVTLMIVNLHAENTSSQVLNVSATRLSNGKNYTQAFPPGATTDFPVPTTAANRLQLFVNADGKLDGVDWRIW